MRNRPEKGIERGIGGNQDPTKVKHCNNIEQEEKGFGRKAFKWDLKAYHIPDICSHNADGVWNDILCCVGCEENAV